MKVGVLGGGAGGAVLAHALATDGHDVTLASRSGTRLDRYREAGGIWSTRPDGTQDFARVAVSTDLAQLARHMDAIVLAVPSSELFDYADRIVPSLRADQVLLLNPGGVVGTTLFVERARRMNPDWQVAIAETETLSLNARLTADGVRLLNEAQVVGVAAYGNAHGKRAMSVARELFSNLVPRRCVLETMLSSFNPVIHPPLMLVAAADIEQGRISTNFYGDYVTPATCGLMEEIDLERREIARAFGLTLPSTADAFLAAGLVAPDSYQGTLLSALEGSPACKDVAGPEALTSRFLTEDVGVSMLTWQALATRAGIDAGLLTAVARVSSALLNAQFPHAAAIRDLVEAATLEHLLASP